MDAPARSLPSPIGPSTREFRTGAKSDEALSSSQLSRKRRAPSESRSWEEYGSTTTCLETGNDVTNSISSIDSGSGIAEMREKELGEDRERFSSRFGAGRRRIGYQPVADSRKLGAGFAWNERDGIREIGESGRREGERLRKIRKLDLSATPLPLISPNAHRDRMRSPSLSPASSTFSTPLSTSFSFPESPSLVQSISTKSATIDSRSVTPSRPHFSFLPYDHSDDIDQSARGSTRIATPIRTHFFSTTPSLAFSTSLYPIPDLVDGSKELVESSAGPIRTRPWQRPKPTSLPLKRSRSQSSLGQSPSRHYSITKPVLPTTKTPFSGVALANLRPVDLSWRQEQRIRPSGVAASKTNGAQGAERRLESQVGKKIEVDDNPGEAESGVSPLLRRNHRAVGLPRSERRPVFFPTPAAPLTPTEILSLHQSDRYSSSFPFVPSSSSTLPACSLVSTSPPCSLVSTSLLPPITRNSLRELDLAEILKNPALRHDVFQDEGLMFRANYDGERGDRKRRLTDRYWHAVAREINTGCRCTTSSSTTDEVLECICATNPTIRSRPPLSRIGPLIAELRTIILSLLPLPTPRSLHESTGDCSAREIVIKNLDPAYIESALITSPLLPSGLPHAGPKPELDISGLARFIGSTLKVHCAPMRDSEVDAMVQMFLPSEVGGGAGEGLARGLQKAFEIVESMKIDIANHQLRTLRPYLLSTAVEFETKAFKESLANNESFARSSNWIAQAHSAASKSSNPNVLVEGLLEIIFLAQKYYGFKITSTTPSSSILPETLRLDSVRLSTLHHDVTDLTIVYLLLSLYRQLSVPSRVSEVELRTLKKELGCLMGRDGDAGVTGGLTGINKLKCPLWRGGMKGVLLHIAVRAGSPTSPPSESTISLVNSFFETNFTTDGKLFQLLQGRLRSTIQLAIHRSLLSHSPSTTTKNGLPSPASAKAIATITSDFETSLVKNGLGILEEEITGVAERMAKVVGFHELVYGQWYRARIEEKF